MNFTAWHAWVSAWVAWTAGALATLGSYTAGIWMGSGQWGLTGLLLMFVCIFSVVPLSIWTFEHRPDRPESADRLTRAQRRELERERGRILLEKKIAEMEKQELSR